MEGTDAKLTLQLLQCEVEVVQFVLLEVLTQAGEGEVQNPLGHQSFYMMKVYSGTVVRTVRVSAARFSLHCCCCDAGRSHAGGARKTHCLRAF